MTGGLDDVDLFRRNAGGGADKLQFAANLCLRLLHSDLRGREVWVVQRLRDHRDGAVAERLDSGVRHGSRAAGKRDQCCGTDGRKCSPYHLVSSPIVLVL